MLTSTHEKVFSSGGNLAGFAADVPLIHKHLETGAQASRACSGRSASWASRRCARPTGTCSPARSGLALACDLIVAREGVRFGTPEIDVGVFPFMIMALIYRNVGRKKTNELLLLGEQIPAAEAERIGIVNRVVPAEEFDAAVADWAGRLAAKSPLMMRLGKDAMFRQQDMAFADALAFLQSQLTIAFSTEDIQEGVQGVLREARSRVDRPVSARVDGAARPHVGPHGRGRRGRRGARRGARHAARRRAELEGAIGAPRDGRWADDLRDGRAAIAAAGTALEAALDAGELPVLLASDCTIAMATLPLLAAREPRRASSGSTPTATSTRPRPPPRASSAACASPPRAGAGTRASPGASTPRASCSATRATSTPASGEELGRAGVARVPPADVAAAVRGERVFLHLDLDVLDPWRCRSASRRRTG